MSADLKAALGRRIRELRAARGMSQAALARAVGASQRDLGRYEAGKTLARIGRLDIIATALGVNLRELFPGGDDAHRFAPEVVAVALLVERAAKADPLFPKKALRLLRSLLDL